MSKHVGPVIFNLEKPRKQLVEGNEVFTFRLAERTTGETWWRKSRTGEKQGDCLIEFIAMVSPLGDGEELNPYYHHSGFETIVDWQQAIRDIHGGCLPASGRLYRVIEGHDDE